MLKTLLGLSTFRKDPHTLQLYIVAVSFPKMLHRLQSRRVSKYYFDCLNAMELNTFDFPEQPTHPPTPLHTHTAAPGSKDEDPDKMFLDSLPGLTKATTDISTLLAARTAKSIGTPCEIYNKDTFRAFHNLLCEMLHKFLKSLIRLEEISRRSIKNRSRDLDEIVNQLRVVSAMGRSLKAMVTGDVIEKHLKTIAHLLVVDDGKSWTVGAEEGDAEFDTLKAYSTYRGRPLLPWQSYKDWLRLMVIYFDAASILRNHFLSHYPSDFDIKIEMKVLAPYLPSEDMLPWKDLLRHNTYFPELLDDPGQPSVKELLTFLTSEYAITEDTRNEAGEGGSINVTVTEDGDSEHRDDIVPIIRSVANLEKLQEKAIAAQGIDVDNLTKSVETVREQVSRLKDCSSDGSAECIKAIFENIEALKRPKKTPRARLLLIHEIVEMLETLRARSALYWALKEGKPLSTGKGFTGTRHCEACLAGFNSLSGQPSQEPSQYDAILMEFAVSLISYFA